MFKMKVVLFVLKISQNLIITKIERINLLSTENVHKSNDFLFAGKSNQSIFTYDSEKMLTSVLTLMLFFP